MPRVTGAQAALRLGPAAELGDWIHAVAWAPDGSAVVAACADGAVVELDATGGESRERHRHEAPATTVAWSPTGVLASGGQDGRVLVDERTAVGEERWIERVAWRPDGDRLAVAAGRRVLILDSVGERVAVSAELAATVTCLSWHPRGTEVAAGAYGGVRLLWGRDAGVAKSLAWKGSVLEMAISPDGRRLAHGNQDASVHFWNLSRGSELEMWGYETKVRQLAWRHDGRLLATGGGDSVTVWDFAGRGPEGSRPQELEGHGETVSWLGFRPNSRLLASTGLDGLAVLWRPGAGDLPLATVAVDDRITAGAWSPDGRRLAIGGADGTLAVAVVDEVDERP